MTACVIRNIAKNVAEPVSNAFEDRVRRVVAADAADPAAAPRPGTADEDVVDVGLHAPPADLVVALRERPVQLPVEDVATRQSELFLQVQWCARLDAQLTVGVAGQAVPDRL